MNGNLQLAPAELPPCVMHWRLGLSTRGDVVVLLIAVVVIGVSVHCPHVFLQGNSKFESLHNRIIFCNSQVDESISSKQ